MISEDLIFEFSPFVTDRLERIIFDDRTNDASLLTWKDGEFAEVVTDYEFIPPDHIGIRGRLKLGEEEILFPVTPLARVGGSRGQYFIARFKGDTFLCPRAIGQVMIVIY